MTMTGDNCHVQSPRSRAGWAQSWGSSARSRPMNPGWFAIELGQCLDAGLHLGQQILRQWGVAAVPELALASSLLV
jgi:hypothetical protein